MTQDTPRVAAARIRAETARARLIETARELQGRVSPRHLAQNAWEGAKLKGADIAEDAVDAVRARPVAATGIVAALALFLARDPLKDLAGKMADGASSRREVRRTRKAGKKNFNETRTETVE